VRCVSDDVGATAFFPAGGFTAGGSPTAALAPAPAAVDTAPWGAPGTAQYVPADLLGPGPVIVAGEPPPPPPPSAHQQVPVAHAQAQPVHVIQPYAPQHVGVVAASCTPHHQPAIQQHPASYLQQPAPPVPAHLQV